MSNYQYTISKLVLIAASIFVNYGIAHVRV
jgi:hypothetical protein